MKSTKVSTTVILALMPAAVLMATPSVHLQVPPPGRYGIEDLWKATVISDTGCDASFEGWVFEAAHGQVFHATTMPFPLTRGTKVYRYRDVRIDQTQTAPGYEAFVTRSGGLPQGNYSFRLVLRPFGVGDSFRFEVKPVGPPRLISPTDGAKLGEEYPDFIWTAPANSRGGVTYRLRIVEVEPGQTKEEALLSNPPLLEQSDIRAMQFRYPLARRQLERNRQYAWRVEAVLPGGAGSRIASDVRGFLFAPQQRQPVARATLTLTREVVRQGNGYSVTLNLRNNTSSDMTNVVVVDSSLGFQVLDRAVVYIKFEGMPQPYVLPGTFETGTDDYGSTSWLKVTKPNLTIPTGKTLIVGYTMMPLQYIHVWGPGFVAGIGCRVTYKVGDEQRAKSFNAKSVQVNDCADAWKTADYLIVTDPIKLYQLNSGARADVDKLLATMARLASAKKGVLLHFPATSATQMRQAITLTGTILAPGWKNGGYLLLVGESEIVPCWDTVRRHPTRPLPWSDHPYSDIDNDDYPELKVGRIIGTTAASLTVPIQNSLAVFFHENGAHYDGSNVLIVTGVEKADNNFTPSAGPGAHYLNGKGLSAHYWGMEFINTRANTLGKALVHTPVENGGAPLDTFNYMVGHYSEPQLAAWLFAVVNPGAFSAQYPVKPTDTYFNDVLGRSRRLPDGFGSTGIAQAVQQAEAIENARRGQWAGQLYGFPASPNDSTVGLLKTNLPKYDALFFSAHGNFNLFSRLTTTVADGSDYTSDKRRPAIVSFACWNGDYPHNGSLARSFLSRGVAALAGYTAMTSTGWFNTEVRDSTFLRFWAKSRRVGDVFWDWKNLLAQTATTDSGNLRMLFGHNLYGDPKFGGN